MPAIPKLLSLALVFLTCLTPLLASAQREVVLGLLLILAALDAGAAVKTTVVAMEQVAAWVAELLSVRVLPFYLAMSALAWVGIPPTVTMGGSAKASTCQTCASSAAGAMCGAEGRGGCGSGKTGASGSACGCSSKTATPVSSPRPLNSAPIPAVSRVMTAPVTVTKPVTRPSPVSPSPVTLPASATAMPAVKVTPPPSPAAVSVPASAPAEKTEPKK